MAGGPLGRVSPYRVSARGLIADGRQDRRPPASPDHDRAARGTRRPRRSRGLPGLISPGCDERPGARHLRAVAQLGPARLSGGQEDVSSNLTSPTYSSGVRESSPPPRQRGGGLLAAVMLSPCPSVLRFTGSKCSGSEGPRSASEPWRDVAKPGLRHVLWEHAMRRFKSCRPDVHGQVAQRV